MHNNVNKKHNKKLQSNSRSNSPNRINEKSGTEGAENVSVKANGTGITADIIRRVSRYQKHCQQLEKSDYIEPKNHSDSPDTKGIYAHIMIAELKEHNLNLESIYL